VDGIDNSFSKEEKTFGVPQGTVLGLYLFLIYVNGLLNLVFDGMVICFVDDGVLFFNNKYIDKLYDKANIGLALINQW